MISFLIMMLTIAYFIPVFTNINPEYLYACANRLKISQIYIKLQIYCAIKKAPLLEVLF